MVEGFTWSTILSGLAGGAAALVANYYVDRFKKHRDTGADEKRAAYVYMSRLAGASSRKENASRNAVFLTERGFLANVWRY